MTMHRHSDLALPKGSVTLTIEWPAAHGFDDDQFLVKVMQHGSRLVYDYLLPERDALPVITVSDKDDDQTCVSLKLPFGVVANESDNGTVTGTVFVGVSATYWHRVNDAKFRQVLLRFLELLIHELRETDWTPADANTAVREHCNTEGVDDGYTAGQWTAMGNPGTPSVPVQPFVRDPATADEVLAQAGITHARAEDLIQRRQAMDNLVEQSIKAGLEI